VIAVWSNTMMPSFPRRLSAFLTRASACLSAGDRDRELGAELDAHLQAHIDDNLRAGMTYAEARRHASLTLGGVEMTKDTYREQRGLPRLEHLARDLRHAFRTLRRSPVFAGAAVFTLALAIAANVSIFTVVYRVLLNPLPYGDSNRLIALDYGVPSRNITSGITFMTWQLYYQLADRAHTLDGVAAYNPGGATLSGSGNPERIASVQTTPSLAAVLRVRPALGRWFAEEEGVSGAPAVVVLSHGLWARRFGLDPAIVGQSIRLDGVPTQVVGVMPAGFAFPDSRTDVWLAAQSTRASASFLFTLIGVARLRDGATIDSARAEMTALIADLARTSPNQAGMVASPTTLQQATVGRVADTLWILLASVGLVLLVACANIANLFLVRSEARQREVAVRQALGASRRAIARYFLAESALLSIAGGAAGLALAWGAVRLVVAFGPANLPRLDEIRLDRVVVAFTFALSVLTGLLFGAIPLLRIAPLPASLHEAGRGNTASRGRYVARHLLMGSQVALALVLVVASGLMVRSFQKLRNVDPGFDPVSALTFRVGLPDRQYSTRRAAVAVHQAILDRVSTVSGVTAVSVSTCQLLSGTCFGNGLFTERRLEDGKPRPFVWWRAVSGGYFATAGMRMLRGRAIDRGDVERAEPIIVVNKALADTYFPNQEPIGQRVRASTPPNSRFGTPEWLTIVGVVANTATTALAEATPAGQLYMPMSIAGGPEIPAQALVGPDVITMSYVVRTATQPAAAVAAVRSAIAEVDPNVALADVRPLQTIVDRASEQMAFTMVLIAIAAGVALVLGMIGIYGVMSFIVAQRTSEIGVRLALGAEPGRVAGMIVRQGGLVALAGVAVGLATAFAGSRLITSLLYGVSSRDPGVFAAATLTLMSVALLACWLPARRAATVDPLVALRAE
jgi:putative ABC transport system permease protein